MTKSQSLVLSRMVKGYERVKTIVTVLGEDEDGLVIGELDAPVYNQKFTIGKRGGVSWKYKFNKI